MKVYLAGGFYGSWKDDVKKVIEEYYDPELHSNQQSISSYVVSDLDGIDGCDLIFAYLTSYPVYGGLAAELGYAYARGKPILLVSNKGEVDGFLLGLARWFCTTLDDGIKRLVKVAK